MYACFKIIVVQGSRRPSRSADALNRSTYSEDSDYQKGGPMATEEQSQGSRAQQVAAAIENQLLMDRTPVGSPLGRRTDLMEQYRMSPTVANEVLRILRDRGLVVVKPGPGGGVFVASQPPQVRLGALDLWFTGTGTDPLALFEARTHLEEILTRVAVDRATPSDVRDMEWAVEELRNASGARAFLEATLRLHMAIARASRITVLAGMYEAIATLISGSLTRAELLPGHEDQLRHNIEVHTDIVSALRDRDRARLDKLLLLHKEDLVRVEDPSRSPVEG
jgi:DNA-binding FadR family transcriptional regulator